jgi:hypothetical protein
MHFSVEIFAHSFAYSDSKSFFSSVSLDMSIKFRITFTLTFLSLQIHGPLPVAIDLPPNSTRSGPAVNSSWAISQLNQSAFAGVWDVSTQPINPITLMAWAAGVSLFRTDMGQTMV